MRDLDVGGEQPDAIRSCLAANEERLNQIGGILLPPACSFVTAPFMDAVTAQ